MVKEKRPVIGISMGDPNGIGTEIIIKSLSDRRINEICTPIIYGSQAVFNFYQKELKNTDFKLNIIATAEEAKKNAPNLIECGDPAFLPDPGNPSTTSGKMAFDALTRATIDLKEGHVNGMVTAPINKSTIQSEAFDFPGHTEYLAQIDGASESLMLLVSDGLKVAVATGHVPIADVAKKLNTDLIALKIELMNKSLIQDFGISRPKIAVLGLNPHASDNGLIGSEEQNIILPAISQVKTKQIFAFGPFPADGFFGSGNYQRYDGILAMYHDQGLIPMKTLSFNSAVNYTAGLSFVRTSPDHGTAYDIVGKDIASIQSFRNALYLACDISKQRKQLPEPKKTESKAVSADQEVNKEVLE
jgi:4-hydroxythreonine-4-phosphate dehydrogenase